MFRADPARSRASALAVLGSEIVAVGDDATVSHLIGPNTEVVDLAGRMVCPGFQDAHVHPLHGGRRQLTCDVTELGSRREAEAVIGAYDGPWRGDWLTGGGWKFEWFARGTPSAEALDRLVPDRPAYLVVADGHAAWVNSRALALAAIDRTTPDPPDGRIERHPDGRPQGTLHEGAMDIVARLLPRETSDEVEAAVLAGQRRLLAAGVTAWQDAWVTSDLHRAYVRLDQTDRLIGTVRGSLWWDRATGPEQLAWMREARNEGTARYRPDAVKLMLDGVVENFTAALLDSYVDDAGLPTGNLGIDMIDPAALPGVVGAIMSAGFQPHFHAIGDAAVRNALDAVAAAGGGGELRPHIAHIQVVHPDDLPRFRKLGVAANAQPLWACADAAMTDLTLPYLGPKRGDWQYPFGSLLRHGAVLAMGSDWPVSDVDVLAQLGVAVERRPPGDADATPFLASECITLADALMAFTAGSAFVNHLERRRGRIEPGWAADLVVLSADPFDDLGSVTVDATMVEGVFVHERGK